MNKEKYMATQVYKTRLRTERAVQRSQVWEFRPLDVDYFQVSTPRKISDRR